MVVTEEGKRLLILKGFQPEVIEEPKVDSGLILKQYREKKAKTNASMTDWDDLEGQWNPDNTLNRLVFYKNGEVLYTLDFMWDATGRFLGARRT